MKTLLTLIKTQTEDFKNDFLKKYKLSVEKELNFINDNYEINTVYSQIQKETGVRNIYHTRKEYLKAEKYLNILYAFKHNKVNEIINKEMIKAENDFESKQKKLALRLSNKGFDDSTIVSINYSYPNLEGFAKCKDKMVNMYTIVAEGPVQRPHYRYLIK